MAITTSVNAPSYGGIRKAALIVVGAVAFYFVYQYTLRYFLWSEEATVTTGSTACR